MTQQPAEITPTQQRIRFLERGMSIRVSDLSDALGGYSATIVDTGDRLVWIDLPIRRDGMLTLNVGQLVSIRFDRRGDAVYLFDTVVAEVHDDDTAPYGLAYPVTIDRRGHRSDVRLALVLDATYRVGDDSDRHHAKVVDLSAGGLGLITAQELDDGALVWVGTDLPSPDEPLRIESQVVIRSRNLYGRTPAGAVLYQYGMQFVDVNDVIREKILASVIWNLTQNPAVL